MIYATLYRSTYPHFPIICIILLSVFDAQFILSSIFNETPFSTTVSVGGVTSGRGGAFRLKNKEINSSKGIKRIENYNVCSPFC